MSDLNNNSFEQTFFIIPAHIMNLPGLTLSYLKVYQTIFQFWNHNKPCFLSLSAITLRTGVGRSAVCEALLFFEKHKELERRVIGKKRYLVRPEQLLETDSFEEKTSPQERTQPVRRSGLNQSAGADIKIKNLNKEKNSNNINITNPIDNIIKPQKQNYSSQSSSSNYYKTKKPYHDESDTSWMKKLNTRIF